MMLYMVWYVFYYSWNNSLRKRRKAYKNIAESLRTKLSRQISQIIPFRHVTGNTKTTKVTKGHQPHQRDQLSNIHKLSRQSTKYRRYTKVQNQAPRRATSIRHPEQWKAVKSQLQAIAINTKGSRTTRKRSSHIP